MYVIILISLFFKIKVHIIIIFTLQLSISAYREMNILFNMMYHEVNELFELNQQQYFTDIKKKSAYIPLGLEHSN